MNLSYTCIHTFSTWSDGGFPFASCHDPILARWCEGIKDTLKNGVPWQLATTYRREEIEYMLCGLHVIYFYDNLFLSGSLKAVKFTFSVPYSTLISSYMYWGAQNACCNCFWLGANVWCSLQAERTGSTNIKRTGSTNINIYNYNL